MSKIDYNMNRWKKSTTSKLDIKEENKKPEGTLDGLWFYLPIYAEILKMQIT